MNKHPVYSVMTGFKAKYGFSPCAYKAALYLSISDRLAKQGKDVLSVIAMCHAMRNGWSIN